MAIGIDKPLPQHHVTSALTVHRPALSEVLKPSFEASGVRQRARVQFRIAAGEPACVAIFRRWLISEWREGDNLSAGAPPTAQHMGIDEGRRYLRQARCAVQ